MRALGVHVFAGGFTMGVKREAEVEAQLETHGFGTDTVEQVAGVPVINCDAEKWPKHKAELIYGNPRCTGFSTVTSGYGDDVHGPWAKQTCDIHELCHYSAGKADVVVWESVQQAYGVGRPLVDYCVKEYFKPKGYRIAHVFLNAASFGNAQQRKRYFFVAYRGGNFNVEPPRISKAPKLSYDVLWPLRDRKAHEGNVHGGTDYDFDTYRRLTPEEKQCVPKLPEGWCLNLMGRYARDLMPEAYRMRWETRTSDMPFSLHCLYRMPYLRPYPTLTSSSCNNVHPEFDRPVTIGEACTAMGWPKGKIPIGRLPFAQVAKGVVPALGTWLAQQAKMCIAGEWGKEDYESRYDAKVGEWLGRETRGEREKVFDLTEWVGREFRREDYEVTDAVLFRHRHTVARRVGRYSESS